MKSLNWLSPLICVSLMTRLQLFVLVSLTPLSALAQGTLPYRDAVACTDKAGVTGLFISFESLTAAEQSDLDLTGFPRLKSIDFYSGAPNEVYLDSLQYASITDLSLNGCGLLELPRWVMQGDTIAFTKLASLAVRANKLKRISICGLENLVALDIAFNKGVKVDCLRNSSMLTELSADGSGLDLCELPHGLVYLSIKLYDGRIARDEFSCLSTIASLRSLDISTNAINKRYLLRYLDASAIDSLYLYNISMSARHRSRFSDRKRQVVFYNGKRRVRSNPLGSEPIF